MRKTNVRKDVDDSYCQKRLRDAIFQLNYVLEHWDRLKEDDVILHAIDHAKSDLEAAQNELEEPFYAHE